MLARLGGDEFVLVLPGAGAREAEDLLDRLAAVSVTPWTSGVAAARPDTDLQQLLLEADRALYAAKAARQTVVLPEPRSARQPGLTPT